MSELRTSGIGGEVLDPKDVLAGTAAEIDRLARMATDMDDAIGDLVATGSDLQLRHIAQNVDALRQSIECVGRLVRNLSVLDLTAEALPVQEMSEGVYLQAVREACFGPKSDSILAANAQGSAEFLGEQRCKR